MSPQEQLAHNTAIANVHRICEQLKAHSLYIFVGPNNEVITTPRDSTFYLHTARVSKDFSEWNSTGLVDAVSDIEVNPGQVRDLNTLLKCDGEEPDEDDTTEVRRLSTWTTRRCFVYCDIAGFSQEKPAHQAFIITTLGRLVNTEQLWGKEHTPSHDSFKGCDAHLCIGDGYIFVFRKSWKATYFAAYLARLIEEMVAVKGALPVNFHFRIGVHVGPIYFFWDLKNKKWNYIGEGINGGNRVLSAIGKDIDDVIFISGDVRSSIMASKKIFPEMDYPHQAILNNLHNRGRKADKHQNMWRVYELNHSGLIARADMPNTLRLG